VLKGCALAVLLLASPASAAAPDGPAAAARKTVQASMRRYFALKLPALDRADPSKAAVCDLAVSGDDFSLLQERLTQRLDDCGSTVYLTTDSVVALRDAYLRFVAETTPAAYCESDDDCRVFALEGQTQIAAASERADGALVMKLLSRERQREQQAQGLVIKGALVLWRGDLMESGLMEDRTWKPLWAPRLTKVRAACANHLCVPAAAAARPRRRF